MTGNYKKTKKGKRWLGGGMHLAGFIRRNVIQWIVRRLKKYRKTQSSNNQQNCNKIWFLRNESMPNITPSLRYNHTSIKLWQRQGHPTNLKIIRLGNVNAATYYTHPTMLRHTQAKANNNTCEQVHATLAWREIYRISLSAAATPTHPPKTHTLTIRTLFTAP